MRRIRTTGAGLILAAAVLAACPGTGKTKAAEPSRLTGETEASEAPEAADTPADGAWEPDGFSWSGGTGRVEIFCRSVEIREGQAWAVLVFDSDAYGYLRVDGEEYLPVHEDGTSVFEIPVRLNETMEITGMTTRMSQAHEITYQIYIPLSSGTGDSEEEPGAGEGPALSGLAYLEPIPLASAEYFRLHQYEQGVILLEISMTGEPFDGGAQTEEAEGAYGGDTVAYLIAPGETELPAGAEKNYVVIQGTPEKVCICSEAAGGWMEQKDEDRVAAAGDAAELDYRSLVTQGCDLVILSEKEAVGETENEQEARQELLETLEYCEMLGIPVIIDRSDQEKTEAGRREWSQVWAVLSQASEAETK